MFIFQKSVHEQVSVFKTTLMNIFSSYIPSKYITFDTKDPSWPREKIKKKRLNKTVYINDIFLVLNINVIIIYCKVYLVNFLT